MLMGQVMVVAFAGFMAAWAIVFAMVWSEAKPLRRFDGCCCCGGQEKHGVVQSEKFDNVCDECEPWFVLAQRFNWDWDATWRWINRVEDDARGRGVIR